MIGTGPNGPHGLANQDSQLNYMLNNQVLNHQNQQADGNLLYQNYKRIKLSNDHHGMLPGSQFGVLGQSLAQNVRAQAGGVSYMPQHLL